MAKLAIFAAAVAAYFRFDVDTEVQIEYLGKEEALELSKAVDKVVNRTGADRVVVWNQKLGERVVKGWRHITIEDHPGFTLPDGTSIQFTPENRDMLMKSCREFSVFVQETAIDGKTFLDIQQDRTAKEEIKND